MEDLNEQLLKAVKYNGIELVEQFIKAGADVNRADIYGYTPLDLAIFRGRAELIKIIIDAGADVNRATKYSWTPLLLGD